MEIKVKLLTLVFFMLVRLLVQRKKLRNIVLETMKDNDVWNDNTKLSIFGRRKFSIKNYKKRETIKIKKFVHVLADELESNLVFTRKRQVLKIKEIPKVRRKGIFEQSIEDGVYKRYLKKNIENGFLIAGKTGSGKSVLANKLLADVPESSKYIVSPKGDEDFVSGHNIDEISEERVLEIIEQASNGEFKNGSTMWIVLDELISITGLWSKATIEKINTSITISRSQNLKWVLLTQTLQKTSVSIKIGLVTVKMINIPDISNYTGTIGQEVKTNTNLLKKGEFVLLDGEGQEKILINNI